MQRPTVSDYEPHIFTVFRTAKNGVSLSFVAKDASGKVLADQSAGVSLHAAYRRLSQGSNPQVPLDAAGLGNNESSDKAAGRGLFGMRRRMSSARRRGGAGGGLNMNPTTWFSPRRRVSVQSPTSYGTSYGASSGAMAGNLAQRRRGAISSTGSSTGPAAASFASPRRRGTAATGYGGYNSFRRRRTVAIGGGSSAYQNPYSSYMGSYGYPSAAYAMSAFGGHSPVSTPYGYSGMNAYQGSTGSAASIAMAGGAGLLAGYVGSSLLHPYYHHHYSWGGYTRDSLYGMPCTSGPWSGSCSSCVSLYGPHSCNVMMSPKIDATRDDLMNTGFVPSQVAWPVTVNITKVSGQDFSPETLCPPSHTGQDWSPPPMKQLFLTLSSLNSQANAAAGDPMYAGAPETESSGSGFFNLILLCCCMGGLYYSCGKGRSSEAYGGPMPYSGPMGHMGHLGPTQAGYAQPSTNPYWQGGGAGTQLAQPMAQPSAGSSSPRGGFMGSLAPNGKTWSEYCRRAAPEISPTGNIVIGPWGECLAWAVMYEHQNKDWEQDPQYQAAAGGPAGSVIEAMTQRAPASEVQAVGRAAEELEEACRKAIAANRTLPVINQRA